MKTFKFVLLVHLHNSFVQRMTSVSDLLQLFCMGIKRAVDIAAACHDHLYENGSKDLVFLFDGFDEYPEKVRKNGFIADILKRKILPYCACLSSVLSPSCDGASQRTSNCQNRHFGLH